MRKILIIEDDPDLNRNIKEALIAEKISKLNFLKYVLLITFFVISLAMVIISYFLSSKISFSMIDLIQKIRNYDFEMENNPITVAGTKD